MNTESKWIVGVAAGLLVLCCCLGLAAACLLSGGMLMWTSERTDETVFPQVLETIEVPGSRPATVAPAAPTLQSQEPAGSAAFETLETLRNTLVPINDPIDLALRLQGKTNVPSTLPVTDLNLPVGAAKTFWATNVDTNESFRVSATLRYVTDHLYFWIEDGVRYDANDLRRLAETFENDIYPTNREFFGSEWSPGVDQDPRLYVLYASGLGSNLAGYFSSADSLHPEAHEYSNAHEMFFINSDNVNLGDQYVYSTMAHEFQHMIHWYRDRNEESWLNEGFSVLAELLNGYRSGGFDVLYVMNPDLQLTTWPGSPQSRPHYGASFLFVAYFLDRFGEAATQAVVMHPDNGMDSIDAVLRELDIRDPLNSQVVGADDVFANWVVATYLNDPGVGDGRFAYQRYENAPSAGNTESVRACPTSWETRTVSQYGVDYIAIDCRGSLTLTFEGATEVDLLPVGPVSGDYAFWSNRGDESDMTLTREFDFTGVSGPLTLTYSTWYDLETDYDYLYLVASEDGQAWQILQTPSSTDADPSGNSYGWAYNGQSDGWIEEQVDLSQFAGKQVQLRFEYITDAAVNGQGLLLDDVRIPEIGYSTDFEEGDGGWTGDGFVRIQNRLPQTFALSLIEDGRTVSVERLVLDDQQRVTVELDLSGARNGAVLVVSGTTRFTLMPASYRFKIE